MFAFCHIQLKLDEACLRTGDKFHGYSDNNINFNLNFSCISLNIRGLNKSIKRRKLFRWLHNSKSDIIFLQETYSDPNIESYWRAEWGGDVYFSHGTKHSRGVMILFRPAVKPESVQVISDKNGRFLILNAAIDGEDFVFVNIYSPNDQNTQVTFYENLLQKLRPFSTHNIILGGDFNCPLENIDKVGGKDISTKKKVIHLINELSNNLDLIDVWRLQNPTETRFTWSNNSGKIRCRLDYWLVSQRLIPSVNNTAIKSYFEADHSPIFIAFRQESKSGKSRGPGLWKFNNSLLENEDFVTKLKFYVGYAKGKHRQCTSKKLYWEMIKMEIRDFSIRFSKRLAHRKKPTEISLLCKLQQLHKRVDQNPNDTPSVAELQRTKTELQRLAEHKTKGAIIRSKARWYELGEKNNKYFFQFRETLFQQETHRKA